MITRGIQRYAYLPSRDGFNDVTGLWTGDNYRVVTIYDPEVYRRGVNELHKNIDVSGFLVDIGDDLYTLMKARYHNPKLV